MLANSNQSQPTVTSDQSNSTNSQKHKVSGELVSGSGALALLLGTVCGVSALKKIKFKNKFKVHRVTAYLAAAATALHVILAKASSGRHNKN
jgi:hypothetical protein